MHLFFISVNTYFNKREKISGSIVHNLDPAVHYLPCSPKFDIRDKFSVKSIMNTYNLGPNGAISTSLNLLSANISDLINSIEKNRINIFDTPGQIEVFNWSASGQIITEALSNQLTTVLLLDYRICH